MDFQIVVETQGHMLQREPPPPDPKSSWVEAPDPTSELPPYCLPCCRRRTASPLTNGVDEHRRSGERVHCPKTHLVRCKRNFNDPKKIPNVYYSTTVICCDKFLNCELVSLPIGIKYRVWKSLTIVYHNQINWVYSNMKPSSITLQSVVVFFSPLLFFLYCPLFLPLFYSSRAQ